MKASQRQHDALLRKPNSKHWIDATGECVYCRENARRAEGQFGPLFRRVRS